mmetsp:Transcript_54781/g.120129  ORF Transcript_54781/g.120129 Transcript_54781/m.120129 type:complete len:937 (-) Transcript_54781:84-2894(-)
MANPFDQEFGFDDDLGGLQVDAEADFLRDLGQLQEGPQPDPDDPEPTATPAPKADAAPAREPIFAPKVVKLPPPGVRDEQTYLHTVAPSSSCFTFAASTNCNIRTHCTKREPAPVVDGRDDELLAVPYAELMCQLEEERVAAAARAEEEPEEVQVAEPSDGVMWVDKYRPSSFRDLLTDSSVNKDVVKWLLGWQDNYEKSLLPNVAKDDLQPKVLLIGGEPGVGKTTLAHVAARHAGYLTAESNSSDDRTADTVLTRIEAVCSSHDAGQKLRDTTMKARMLVLDEIDGAAASAVSIICRILDRKAKTKTGTERLAIRRPIICIANDLQARVLKPLRERAKVIEIPPPKPLQVSHRLQQICTKERLRVDVTALHRLVAQAKCDVRMCINTLQYLRRTKGNGRGVVQVGLRDLKEMENASVEGFKDSEADEKSVLAVVFEPRRSRKPSSGPTVDRVCHMVGQHLEFRRVAQVFEYTLLTTPFSDPGLRRTAAALDNLAFGDRVSSRALRTGHFGAMKFALLAPLTYAAEHCAAMHEPKFEFSKLWMMTGLHRRQSLQTSSVAMEMAKKALPDVKRNVSHPRFLANAAPVLLRLISPKPCKKIYDGINICRNHSADSDMPLTPSEAAGRDVLKRVAELMATYGLSYQLNPDSKQIIAERLGDTVRSQQPRPGQPSDWKCGNSTCGALVYGSKNACFKCGAPKPDKPITRQIDYDMVPDLKGVLCFDERGELKQPIRFAQDFMTPDGREVVHTLVSHERLRRGLTEEGDNEITKTLVKNAPAAPVAPAPLAALAPPKPQPAEKRPAPEPESSPKKARVEVTPEKPKKTANPLGGTRPKKGALDMRAWARVTKKKPKLQHVPAAPLSPSKENLEKKADPSVLEALGGSPGDCSPSPASPRSPDRSHWYGDVEFHYNDGCTDAVRKTVFVKDVLMRFQKPCQ